MKSIKYKIIIFMISCMLVLAGAIGITSSFLSINNTKKTLEATMMETAQMSAKYISSELETYAAALYELAQTNVFQDNRFDSAAVAERSAKTATRYGFVEVFKAEANGDIIGNANISDRDYFIQAKSTGTVAFSDLVSNKATGELNMFAAVPIMKNGNFVGAVCATLDGQYLSKITNEIAIGNSGLSYMINNKGYSLAHSNPQMVLDRNNSIERAKTEPALKAIGKMEEEVLKGNPVFGPYTAIDGTEKYVALTPIPNTDGWALGVNVNRMEFLQDTYTSIFIIIILSIIAAIVGILLSIYLANSISVPINLGIKRLVQITEGDLHSPVPVSRAKDETKLLMDALQMMVDGLNEDIGDVALHLGEISQGNLTAQMDREYKGDFKPLETAVKTILSSLNDTLSQINQASDQVNSGSDQVSCGAQALSQGATEQASSIEELSASINEISNQVKQNADNAQNANKLSLHSAQSLDVGSQQMQEVIDAMKDISATSNEIGKIIKTIDDIAFQTNILALNAAVEAARAGAAGKGFAVVADEVRNLSQKSAEAAKNTTALIESSVTAVSNGSKIVDDAAKSIAEVVANTKQVTDVVGRIALASEEQSDSISQVTLGVEQISSVVQTNSATAEESAAASEELSGQAEMLKSLVSRFKLNDSASVTEYSYASDQEVQEFTSNVDYNFSKY